MAFWDKITSGLTKTKKSLADRIESIFSQKEIDDDFYDELEETLILADMGGELAASVIDELRSRVKAERLRSGEDAKKALRDILVSRLDVGSCEIELSTKPTVILVVGVNGVGKTTTIGKLASRYASEGKKVLLCAADTFRAAAADQLEIWAGRANCDIVRQNEGADSAAVVFDGIRAAVSRGSDIVICDTAGRLHNKQNLMNELNKISRVIRRELPEARVETLLVLDAVTGQNGLMQAESFKETTGLTGIVLTKLDGTAKGGIVIAVAESFGIPVKLIGVGEKVDDLVAFESRAFVEALI